MSLQLGEPLTPEVLGALVELTALARKASQATDEHLESVANGLLRCLLHHCQAERGAILLREDQPRVEPSEHPSAALARERGFRALALRQLREADAAALLAPLPTASVFARSPGGMCWRAYRLFSGEGQADAANHRLETLPNASSDLTDRAGTAWLVIGWIGQTDEEQARAALLARCEALLPPLTDAVETVISTLLLKERVDELERKSMREALEGMELLKAELLGTVSHELRSPLASIKGYAATLLRHEHRLAREERHQFLLAINEASDRLELIVERLLEVSQLETGQVTLQRSPVDLVRLAGEAIAVMQERMTASRPGSFVFGLCLEHANGTTGRSVPLILADPRRLREVLDQLLENACTYSPAGGAVTVTIRPLVQPAGPGEGAPRASGEPGPAWAPAARLMLEVCVTDSGQGIPPEHLTRIFERFHRVDTRLTRETGGLGLGLAICKRIIALHDGAIWAENRSPGPGSALYLRLPLDEAAVLAERRNGQEAGNTQP